MCTRASPNPGGVRAVSAIEEKFAQLLLGGVDLGAPAGAELALDDGGSKQSYASGTIYFHPRIGAAFECHGEILAEYIRQGEQASGLGYPLSDQQADPNVAGGRLNLFEGGTVSAAPGDAVTLQFDDMPISPQIALKIVDAFPVAIAQGQAFALDQLGAAVGLLPGNPLLESVRALLPKFEVRRVFDDLDDLEIQALVARAQENDPTYVPPVWSNSLFIEGIPEAAIDGLLDALKLWVGIVEDARRMPTPTDPAVVGTGNPRFADQGYLRPAPFGIGVQAAWAAGADGSGTRFVDLEQGWLLAHEDLPTGIPLLAGINKQVSQPHGCAVLGIVAAIDNAVGIAGIAPATLPRVISYFDPKERVDRNDPFPKQLRARVASRIQFAANSLRRGDVLQLEVQFGGLIDGKKVFLPVETDPDVLKAIELVVKLGVIVVEAAGNGNSNLDNFALNGRFILRRGSADFRDSGAIMVGGCAAAAPHQRFSILVPDPRNPGQFLPDGSNFGSRVDCCAWADFVVTTGSPIKGKTTAKDAYWDGPGFDAFFGGTSAATPIITSMCLLIQHLQTILQPPPGQLGTLGPATMRRILSSARNGTSVTGGVGPMPDFAKILLNEYKRATVNLHVKVLGVPAIPIDQMVANATTLFGAHGIQIVEATRETLVPEGTDLVRFLTLMVGDREDSPSADQADLFNLRGDAGERDIVAYFVRTLVPAAAGCAIHPPGKPGVVISSSMASEWTLAHQIGHVLGLDHVDDTDSLMTRRSTDSLTDLPPDLSDAEVTTMLAGVSS